VRGAYAAPGPSLTGRAKIALGILLERYRTIAVAPDEPLQFYNPWTIISAKRLLVHVEVARRAD